MRVEPGPLFDVYRFDGASRGPSLIVLGAVHGNEICGTRAIERLITEFQAGARQLQAGRLSLVPVTNALAYQRASRLGDRNLNRGLQPTSSPRDNEDHIANALCPLLAEHDVLLDLHSFQSGDVAFVMVGPLDNPGPLERFEHARREEALARCLGVHRAVDGWLAAYAVGVRERASLAARFPEAGIDNDVRYGIGTTEYMRSVGGFGLTLECGQHDDPAAPDVAYRAVISTLRHIGMLSGAKPDTLEPMESLRLERVVVRLHASDRFERPWKSFDRISSGEVIAWRDTGEAVRAPHDGHIVFPNPHALPGREWFYLARESGRLSRA